MEQTPKHKFSPTDKTLGVNGEELHCRHDQGGSAGVLILLCNYKMFFAASQCADLHSIS